MTARSSLPPRPLPLSCARVGLGLALGLMLALTLTACPNAPSAGPDAPTTTDDADDADPEPDPDAPRCGVDTRFVDYAWIPADARLSTAIARHDPELDAALDQLLALADDPDVALPIFAALDYRNLGLQLQTLDRLLLSLDLDPAEVIELHSPGGDFVWIWPTDCTRERVAARVLERHGLMLRVDLDHPSQRRAAGSPETLPFDLITLGERRVAMTLAGRGAAVGAWLADARPDPESEAPPPGELLADIPAAAIRSVLAGEALLTTGPDSADNPARPRQLRATATDAVLDSPPSP